MAEEYQRETAALNTELPQPPTANSLADILHKDGSFAYDNTTDSLEAVRDAIDAIKGSPIILKGTCDSGMTGSTTTIVSADLAGYGDDYFNDNWRLKVVKNTNSIGAAPSGEIRSITDYVSSTGTFTTDAFSANVEENDEILIVYKDTSGITFVSCTTNGAIVEDGSSGTPNVITITAGDASNTFSAWVQVDGSVNADSYICGFTVSQVVDSSVGDKQVLEIGTGSAGNEVTKVRHSFSISATTTVLAHFALPIPIKVSSGTRIAARYSDSVTAASRTIGVSVQYYQSLET